MLERIGADKSDGVRNGYKSKTVTMLERLAANISNGVWNGY